MEAVLKSLLINSFYLPMRSTLTSWYDISQLNHSERILYSKSGIVLLKKKRSIIIKPIRINNPKTYRYYSKHKIIFTGKHILNSQTNLKAFDNLKNKSFPNISEKKLWYSLEKKVREKSRECHNHKPQPFPDSKRKRKPTNPNKHKSNKRRKALRLALSSPSEVIAILKGLKNTRTKLHMERHTTNRPVEETTKQQGVVWRGGEGRGGLKYFYS